MRQLFDDMIHMTEGEKLITYWPLWIGIVVFGVLISIYTRKMK